MTDSAAFRMVQGLYWLSLGTWFGALVMLAIAAAVTFRTVREMRPTLNAPPYNQPALADQAPAIMAGGIVGNVLKALGVVQGVCAGIAVVCVLLQCSVFASQLRAGATDWLNVFRIILIALPIVILVVDTQVITPRMWALRSVMFDPAQPEAARDTSRAQFDALHKLDERIVSASVFLLLAAVFVSAFTFKAGVPITPAPPTAPQPADAPRT